VKSNSKRIRELETELKELRKLEKSVKVLTPTQQITLYMHECLCGWNHTDSCSWQYEKADEWNKGAHAIWYKKAELVLKFVETNNLGKTDLQKITKAKDIVDVFRNIKK
jgi:hypothetical protein